MRTPTLVHPRRSSCTRNSNSLLGPATLDSCPFICCFNGLPNAAPRLSTWLVCRMRPGVAHPTSSRPAVDISRDKSSSRLPSVDPPIIWTLSLSPGDNIFVAGAQAGHGNSTVMRGHTGAQINGMGYCPMLWSTTQETNGQASHKLTTASISSNSLSNSSEIGAVS